MAQKLNKNNSSQVLKGKFAFFNEKISSAFKNCTGHSEALDIGVAARGVEGIPSIPATWPTVLTQYVVAAAACTKNSSYFISII